MDTQSPSEPGKVCRVPNKSLRWGPACWSRSVTTAAGNQSARQGWESERGGKRAQAYEWDGWKRGEEREKCATVERGGLLTSLSWAPLCQSCHSKARKWFTTKPCHPETEDSETAEADDTGPEERLNTSCSGHQRRREETLVSSTNQRWPLGSSFRGTHRQT